MFNGIINVYKEKGWTSHDVVAKLRSILRQKKIGHTGTLDPDAEGVLPVCLGSGTKLCGMLTDQSKEYRAVMLLGVVTDTEDITGRILSERHADISVQQIEKAMKSFEGGYWQTPPMYSAIKIGGKKLYELAREGVEIERAPRHVLIDYIKIGEICLPRVEFTVGCQKGTYIRSLCRDIGEKLGCGACMESLVRTRVGNNTLENALSLREIEQSVSTGQFKKIIQPVDTFFSSYPGIIVSGRTESLVRNGNMFPAENTDDAGGEGRLCRRGASDNPCGADEEDIVRVYLDRGENNTVFAGLYRYDRDNGYYRPFKMFLNGE